MGEGERKGERSLREEEGEGEGKCCEEKRKGRNTGGTRVKSKGEKGGGRMEGGRGGSRVWGETAMGYRGTLSLSGICLSRHLSSHCHLVSPLG